MNVLKDVRFVVLGIDGLGGFILQKIVESFSEFKNLKKLLEEPFFCTVLSELPELSSVNWTSFYTGEGPETHGIFGFIHIDPVSYRSRIVNFNDVKVRTVFDYLGDRGFFCKVINLPNTYPARPINGILISGFVAESFEDSIYPKFLIPILKSVNYVLEPDATVVSENKISYLKDLMNSLDSRKRVFDMLWKDLTWNIFVIIITEFDRLCHFFIKDLFDPSSKYFHSCVNILKKLDEFVGEVFYRFLSLPEPKRLMIVSDHGFDTLETEVDLNVWLRNSGFLSYCDKPKGELDSSTIDDRTYAFALDPGRIYIHKKGVFSRGKVSKWEYFSLLKDIKDGLYEIVYKGKKVIKKVFTKEELYSNCEFVNAPDLLCVPHRHFDLKAKFNREEVFGLYGRSGVHTHDDALLWDSQEEKAGRIRDVGQLILKHFKERLYV